MTIRCKAIEQCFTVALFVFHFFRVCNFGKFINLRFGTVRSERVKALERVTVDVNRASPLH